MLSAILIHVRTTVLIGMILRLVAISFTLLTFRRFPSPPLWIHGALWLLATWFFNLYFWALLIVALRLSRPDF
jgi:hypothetical protein